MRGDTASSILVVTFSRAAATEMKERFFEIRGTEQKRSDFWNISTEFFYGILKAAYHLSAANISFAEGKRNFSILREID